MFYLKNFLDVSTSKATVLLNPTVINVSNGESNRVLMADIGVKDAPLTVKGNLLQDLYIIPTPGHKIYYVINGQTIGMAEGYNLPNPLPVPEVGEGYIFKGWYLDQQFTRPAISGKTIFEDTVLYGRVVENVLRFYLKNAADASRITIDDVSTMVIYGNEYSGEGLSSHYNSETQTFIFSNLGDVVTYSIITKEESTFKNKENVEQSYDSLHGNAIALVPKTATLGDITVVLNWEVGESEGNIFDMYTIGYEGEAPEPDDELDTSCKILELSYSQHGQTFTYPASGEKDFDITYTTFGGDWSRGEYTTISRNAQKNGMNSLEDILRKYSFVFIVNDYNSGKPGTGSPASTFRKNAPNMAMSLMFGQHEYTVNLALDSSQQTESGDKSANWIAFKTRLLGKDEEIASIADIITIYKDGNYSLFDGRNSARTKVYDLNDGGRGIIK